jgi:TPR repeat protein
MMTQWATKPGKAILVAIFCLAYTSIAAQTLPDDATPQEMLKYQEKANGYYEKGKYTRALKVYQEELAPLGDKYAQYMIGFMYFNGDGVEKDQIVASAWYRLAAEQGEESYIYVRDSLMPLLNEQQRQRSDQIFRSIRAKYGDTAVLFGLVRGDIEFLRRRVKSDPFNLDSLGRRNRDRKLDAYNLVAERIQLRVGYLQEALNTDPWATDDEVAAFNVLGEEVEAELRSLEEFNKMAPP